VFPPHGSELLRVRHLHTSHWLAAVRVALLLSGVICYVFCRGMFTAAGSDLGEGEGLHDTFLHTRKLSTGFAWVNGYPVGRFWTAAGPQQALYVPGVWLKAGDNEVVVLVLEGAPELTSVWLDGTPDFSGGWGS
jgi:hypothetical protein